MKDWIVTYTGRKVRPLALQPDDIDIRDIAHALSNICRFTGHTREFYSVAQHCVHVSALCGPRWALWGLLHDASEAYLADLARPVKHHRDFAIYHHYEAEAMLTVAKRFGLEWPEPEQVRWADGVVLAAERRDMMAQRPEDDGYTAQFTGDANALMHRIKPWTPREAELEFLANFDEYSGGVA